jgi:cell division protein FtsQ
MHLLKKVLLITSSTLALVATGYGMYRAMRSPLFTVRVVEMADLAENAPVSAAAIESLAAVPIGQVNLFALNLAEIESRVLSNPWIREARLQKRFPQTLTISVTFREPQALMQGDGGRLSYVDTDGRVFGQVSLAKSADLPILFGLNKQPMQRVREALAVLSTWGESSLSGSSEISSLSWDSDRGYRAWIVYPTKSSRARALVELGQEVDAQLPAQFERLSKVFQYLSANSVAVRQIWADTGKKIVVRTAHGS